MQSLQLERYLRRIRAGIVFFHCQIPAETARNSISSQTSIIQAVLVISINHNAIGPLTAKKPSPGPNTRLGRMIVALGHASRTASSARAFVLMYGILLSLLAPIALIYTIFAPMSFATLATLAVPLYWISSKALGDPCKIPTRDTMTLAPANAVGRVSGCVISTSTDDSKPFGISFFSEVYTAFELREAI